MKMNKLKGLLTAGIIALYSLFTYKDVAAQETNPYVTAETFLGTKGFVGDFLTIGKLPGDLQLVFRYKPSKGYDSDNVNHFSFGRVEYLLGSGFAAGIEGQLFNKMTFVRGAAVHRANFGPFTTFAEYSTDLLGSSEGSFNLYYNTKDLSLGLETIGTFIDEKIAYGYISLNAGYKPTEGLEVGVRTNYDALKDEQKFKHIINPGIYIKAQLK